MRLSKTPVWFYAKKVPRKKALDSGKCMGSGTMDVYNIEIRDLKLKTPLAILNIQMHRKTCFLWKRLRFDLIFQGLFLQGFNSCDRFYFPRFYWQPPYYFRNKSQEVKTYFQWHFVLVLKKIGTFLPTFLFPGFFSRNFFSCIDLVKILPKNGWFFKTPKYLNNPFIHIIIIIHFHMVKEDLLGLLKLYFPKISILFDMSKSSSKKDI